MNTGLFDREQRQACDRMLDAIRAEVRETRAYTGREQLSGAVMEAMARVPRHRFVPPEGAAAAYFNRPLPIGHGQTISQPYMVALMSDLIAPQAGQRVLEVGTGCGYQTAVLAALVGSVCSLEVIEVLSLAARRRLQTLGIDNCELRVGDGWRGWPQPRSFDAILVTAAASRVPPSLTQQLAVGGRMVIPIGPPGGEQTLAVIEKSERGELQQQSLLPVVFVPMVEADVATAPGR